MNGPLARAFEAEMDAAAEAFRQGDLAVAFGHLERAHILGQQHTWPHVRAHLGMLRVGWRRRDAREVVGQVLRVVAAAVMSRVWVPRGNTGGARVSAVRPMPVPQDLRPLLGQANGTDTPPR